MTNEEINKAIAEYCGWKYEFNGNDEDPEWYWIAPNNPDGNETPPDYCNDLNAMHEAENTIKDPIQQSFYAEYLGDCGSFEKGEYPTFRFVNSTAKERAIAFLKIIGKWD